MHKISVLDVWGNWPLAAKSDSRLYLGGPRSGAGGSGTKCGHVLLAKLHGEQAA
jgi:hypothetical protein